MAKFSSNTNTSVTTKVSPFLVTWEYVPRMSFDPNVNFTLSSTCKRLANAKAKLLATCMQKIWNFTYAEMAKSQQAQVKRANKHQKTSSKYKIRDKIWLLTRNIHTERPSKKQNYKKIGFYPIKKLISSLYWLELPTSMQIYNVFYLNLLKLAAKNLLSGQINDSPPSVVVNDEKKIENRQYSQCKKAW